MDKDLKLLVDRLKRTFPKMEMKFDAETFNMDEHGCYQDCAPPYTINWYEFLEKLDKEGLKIINKK